MFIIDKILSDITKVKKKTHIVPHMDKMINSSFLVIPKIENTVRFAFVGHFTKYKGNELFVELSKYIKTYTHLSNEYFIEYHVYGYRENDIEIDNEVSSIIFHGKYSSDTIIQQLHEDQIHGIFHLSIFEESYCYALTESINSGIPILHNERGSFYYRLVENKKYHTFHEIDDLNSFMDYIIENQGTHKYTKIINDIQPNKWYLTNYMMDT